MAKHGAWYYDKASERGERVDARVDQTYPDGSVRLTIDRRPGAGAIEIRDKVLMYDGVGPVPASAHCIAATAGDNVDLDRLAEDERIQRVGPHENEDSE